MQPRTDHPGQYRGKIEPPPDYLTDDQIDLFDALSIGTHVPGGTFTSDGLRHWIAFEFGWVCQLEGVGVPDVSAVLAEIDLRSPGWPGHWTEPRRIERGPSRADPELIDALYPPGGPFGPRPTSPPDADHDAER